MSERICYVCGSRAQKSMVYWSSCKEVKTFIMRHLEVTNVPAGISICRKEVLEAERHLSSINYVPKWKRGGTSDWVATRLKAGCHNHKIHKQKMSCFFF